MLFFFFISFCILMTFNSENCFPFEAVQDTRDKISVTRKRSNAEEISFEVLKNAEAKSDLVLLNQTVCLENVLFSQLPIHSNLQANILYKNIYLISRRLQQEFSYQ